MNIAASDGTQHCATHDWNYFPQDGCTWCAQAKRLGLGKKPRGNGATRALVRFMREQKVDHFKLGDLEVTFNAHAFIEPQPPPANRYTEEDDDDAMKTRTPRHGR